MHSKPERKQNLNKTTLIEETLKNGLGVLSSHGALIVDTGTFTGRAVKDRFVVNHMEQAETVDWGAVNKPVDVSFATKFFMKLEQKLNSVTTYTMHGFVGAFPVEVISTSPWHIAFAKNMFRDSGVESVLKQLPKIEKIKILIVPYGKVSDFAMV